MQKLTKEEFNAMNCQQLREWVKANCVRQSPGRKPEGTKPLTPYERLKRHRQKKSQP